MLDVLHLNPFTGVKSVRQPGSLGLRCLLGSDSGGTHGPVALNALSAAGHLQNFTVNYTKTSAKRVVYIGLNISRITVERNAILGQIKVNLGIL